MEEGKQEMKRKTWCRLLFGNDEADMVVEKVKSSPLSGLNYFCPFLKYIISVDWQLEELISKKFTGVLRQVKRLIILSTMLGK